MKHVKQGRRTVALAQPTVVREVFIVHDVGCTRGVTSNTDHTMKIHARITWGVDLLSFNVMFDLHDQYILAFFRLTRIMPARSNFKQHIATAMPHVPSGQISKHQPFKVKHQVSKLRWALHH